VGIVGANQSGATEDDAGPESGVVASASSPSELRPPSATAGPRIPPAPPVRSALPGAARPPSLPAPPPARGSLARPPSPAPSVPRAGPPASSIRPAAPPLPVASPDAVGSPAPRALAEVVKKSVPSPSPVDAPTRKHRKLEPGPGRDGPGTGGWRGVADQRARITMAESAVIGESDEDSAARVELSVKLNLGEVVPATRYRIIRWLGEGGMGVVYECEHVDIERRVALKILRPGVSPKSRKAKMFREEARAVSRATAKGGGRGSNIVEVYDFGELPDGRMWFAMELLEGRSLAREASQQTISPGRLIGILRQVCKGLAAAHDANVIHRDIKPGNIMLVRSGGRGDVVKIVDFGVAAMLTAEKEGNNVQLEGTPIYMAPEQAAAAAFDHRLDIYAVGAMAFHLIAGVPPFTGDSVFEILRKIRSEVPRRPSEINPDVDVPRALEDVILCCLSKDPDARYDDMRDLEGALCEAQIAAKLVTTWDDLPVPDVDVSRKEMILRQMPERALRRPRRPWWLPYVAAAGAALALGGGAWAMWGGTDAGEELVAEEAIRERVDAARAAAARAYFIYPPVGDSEVRTAYAEVVDLETLSGDFGRTAAQSAAELRHEFAETLVRLGDTYWEREGGRPFALDYYIGALVFEPTNAHARERAPITPGELVALREKAATMSFTESELVASRALTALAEEDDDVRVQKLIELEQDEQPRGLHAELGIKSLLAEEGVVATPDEEDIRIARTPASEKRAKPAAAAEPGADVAGTDDDGEAVRPADRTAARSLVSQGYGKLQNGERDAAERLFNRALERNHRDAKALDGLAQIAFARGDYSAAVRYGKRAVAASPGSAAYRVHLGDAYFKVFRYREAREHYQKAKDLGHGAADTRLEKVRAKLGQ
jgi:tetratricopeptide (TPR) repeat protein/tRNA A-37 threonylcarbamoyl transferase component Bud32